MTEISGPAAAPPPLTLRYRLTVNDMAASMTLRSATLRWFAVIVAAAFLATFGLVWLVNGDTATLVGGVVGAAVILVVLSSAWFRRGVVRSMLRRQSVEQLAHAEVTVSVTAEGLSAQQGATSALIGWPEVTRTRENGEILLVLTGKMARLTVPKHAFPNAAVLAEFRAAVAQGGAGAPRLPGGSNRSDTRSHCSSENSIAKAIRAAWRAGVPRYLARGGSSEHEHSYTGPKYRVKGSPRHFCMGDHAGATVRRP